MASGYSDLKNGKKLQGMAKMMGGFVVALVGAIFFAQFQDIMNRRPGGDKVPDIRNIKETAAVMAFAAQQGGKGEGFQEPPKDESKNRGKFLAAMAQHPAAIMSALQSKMPRKVYLNL